MALVAVCMAVGWCGPLAVTSSAQTEGASFSRFYAGGAFNWVHHTGYVPNSPTQADTAEYSIGGKAFGGLRLNPSLSVEAAYHYLGEVQVEGLPVVTHERSHAVSGSFVFMTPALPQFLGTNFTSWHIMARLGLAYKRITQTSVLETASEGVLSGVIGAGAEFRITPHVFTRIEYEFISTAIGGPTQSAPALNSSFKASFGGTNRVINVMHTPLALTVGIYF
jgi:opacity protein-like surface antigen